MTTTKTQGMQRRMHANVVAAGLCLLTAFAFGAEESIQYDGSSQVYWAFVKETAEAFTKETGIKVEAKDRKTQDAVPALVAGSCNVGGLARKLTLAEKAQGGDLVETLIAKDHIAIFVPANSKVAELTMEQVKKVFAGEIKDWKELGDEPGAIQVVIPQTKTACNVNFTKIALGGAATYAPNALITETAGKVLEEAKGKRAISFISYGAVNTHAEFKVLKVDGKKAGEEGYAIAQSFYLATKGVPTGATKTYLKYFQSGAGKTFIVKAGLLVE
jgi:phosphate transport system substrate-binding protein